MAHEQNVPAAGSSARVHAFGDDALGDLDAVGLAAEIREGRLSCAEVVQAAVARTEKLDGDLHGLAADRFAAAKAEARSPHTGFFAGVPTFVKDNSDVLGLPTQQGTRAYVAHPATHDGDVARLFGVIGTTTLGKTRLSEFGFSPSAEFVDDEPVRNPWNPAYSSGASSAGSAAFVAGGAVPFAHANDGGGSIRIPAACCGLVGLKPTRGRTPTDKSAREQPVQIVHDGVVTRSVRDTAAFVREAERAYRNLELPPVGDVTRPGTQRLRVGLIMDSLGERRTDDQTRAVVQSTADLLESLGHAVEETELPPADHFEDDFLLYWATLALFLSRTGKVTFNRTYDRRRNDHLTLGLSRHAARNAWRLPAAITRLRSSRRLTEALYSSYDVVLSPTLTLTTPQVGWLDPSQDYETLIRRILDWMAFTPFQNATGEPAISLPMGRTADGLPVGVHLSAPFGYDRRLLEVAFELEETHPFARIQD